MNYLKGALVLYTVTKVVYLLLAGRNAVKNIKKIRSRLGVENPRVFLNASSCSCSFMFNHHRTFEKLC